MKNSVSCSLSSWWKNIDVRLLFSKTGLHALALACITRSFMNIGLLQNWFNRLTLFLEDSTLSWAFLVLCLFLNLLVSFGIFCIISKGSLESWKLFEDIWSVSNSSKIFKDLLEYFRISQILLSNSLIQISN